MGRASSLLHSACPILCSNPILSRYFTKIAPSVLPCPKTQEHQSTCVDSSVHRVPENGHQPLGRGSSLWHSACPILWSNPILSRYFTKIAPSVLPCPKTQEHQSTCVDSSVHRVPENGHQAIFGFSPIWMGRKQILLPVLCYRITLNIAVILSGNTLTTSVIVKTFNDIYILMKMDISHWDAPVHYYIQLAQYCAQTLSCHAISRRSPPLCSLALRLRNTKVPVWTHQSIGYPKMDISHWDAAVHYDIQLAQYCDQTLSCHAISRRSPPLCSLALRLRNTKVPVWTHQSIGYPKMDIRQFLAFRPFEWEESKYCYLCYAIG